MESAFTSNLTDYQRRFLIDSVKEKISKTQTELNEQIDLLSQLEGGTPSPNAPIVADSPVTNNVMQESGVLNIPLITREYKETWGWGLKIKFILSKVGHCLTSREIVDELKKYDTKLDNPLKSVSSTLSVKIAQGILFNRYRLPEEENEPTNQGTFFNGLKEWFDEEGKIKDEFRGKE